MRATFANQLAFAEQGREDLIKYRHPFRVDVEIVIQYTSREGRNWDIRFTGSRNKVPPAIREALIREFQNYIRLRIKKNFRSLGFDDFIEMAKAINIT